MVWIEVMSSDSIVFQSNEWIELRNQTIKSVYLIVVFICIHRMNEKHIKMNEMLGESYDQIMYSWSIGYIFDNFVCISTKI